MSFLAAFCSTYLISGHKDQSMLFATHAMQVSVERMREAVETVDFKDMKLGS